MPTPIVIEVGNLRLSAELLDTDAAQAIADLLPIESAFETWGDEYYFPIRLDLPLDNAATLNVSVGDLAYWPPQQSLTIFYGPTPASPGDRPVPASKVIPVGRVLDDPTLLRVVAGVGRIRLRRAVPAGEPGGEKPTGKSGLRRRS
jgi:uncharacterized protein